MSFFLAPDSLLEVLPQAAVKIVYDNDSHSRLYLNMIEEKMHRLFYDQNENGEILPVF